MTNRVAVNVLYHHPKDAGTFEQYYHDVHVPLLQRHAGTIGINGIDLVKFERNADGSRPAFYRMASLWFDSSADLDRGMATPEFRELVDDLGKFASGGVVAMVSRKMA